MAEKFQMTQKGYEEAVKLLKYLQGTKRKEIVARIAEARRIQRTLCIHSFQEYRYHFLLHIWHLQHILLLLNIIHQTRFHAYQNVMLRKILR